MRWVAMLVLGMAIGIFGTVTVLSAMKRETPLSKGTMAVSGHHLGALRALEQGGKCDATTTTAHLQSLRAVAGDFAAAFLPTGGDDALFERRASDYRDALDASIASPPADCRALGETLRRVGGACKACHQDFRG